MFVILCLYDYLPICLYGDVCTCALQTWEMRMRQWYLKAVYNVHCEVMKRTRGEKNCRSDLKIVFNEWKCAHMQCASRRGRDKHKKVESWPWRLFSRRKHVQVLLCVHVEEDMGSEKRRHSDPGECSHLGLGVKFMGGRPRPGFYNSPPILPSFMVNWPQEWIPHNSVSWDLPGRICPIGFSLETIMISWSVGRLVGWTRGGPGGDKKERCELEARWIQGGEGGGWESAGDRSLRIWEEMKEKRGGKKRKAMSTKNEVDNVIIRECTH